MHEGLMEVGCGVHLGLVVTLDTCPHASEDSEYTRLTIYTSGVWPLCSTELMTLESLGLVRRSKLAHRGLCEGLGALPDIIAAIIRDIDQHHLDLAILAIELAQLPHLRSDTPVVLSDRELQVFRLIGQGLTTRQIAEQLELSGKTIETHRAHIKKKLKVEHNTQLLQHAFLWNHGGETP